jgi:hypothetical protein
MVDEVDAPWILRPRERMRARLARAMGRVLRHWQESGQRERAAASFQNYREIDPSAADQSSFKPLVTDR